MLKRVSIQNFKSLKDVTLDLQKVNLLIGPNNSGKTNFLKALEYMAKDNTNQEEPEYDRLVFRQQEGIEIEITLLYDLDENSHDRGFVCTITGTASIQKTELRGQGTGSYLYFDPKKMKDKVGSIVLYKPDPNKLTQPSIVGTGAQKVNADASNLIAFFDYIRDDQPEIFDRIKSDLQECVPEFTEINFQSIPSNEELVKQFGPGTYKRLGLTDSRQGVKYWADELSEGTLYFLSLLCIINQPNPPKLLLLEEPEKGIHPRRIFEVIQFIFQLAEEKDVQVIMTTHSPIVVDMFKDMPESVFIFDKDDEGATHVKNLQHDVIEPETAKSKELGIEPPHYTDSLGHAWTVGFLGGVPK
ncbi:putative ATPase [Spirosoma lacussanchae]|uniref:AAA family ATPase n=1 Tax=Spirosoma lacussanchae TaxID=1884249 RepID=UPI0011084615|nr:AAA family ATPase [Spirosoma lacussanchae]